MINERRLKKPITDPRLLVRIEHVAQAREIALGARQTFMVELKKLNGDSRHLSEETLKGRQARINILEGNRLWENGEPTEAHLSLLMWGYTPDEKRVREWAETITDRVFITENGLVNIWHPHRADLLEATLNQAIPAVHPIASTPIAPMAKSKKSWLFKYHGGEWEVKSITSSGMHLTGNGIVLHASKDIAHQINLPTIAYYNRLAQRMGPPGNLSEKASPNVQKARRAVGVMDDGDFGVDGYGTNDRHPSGEGQAVGQRWKEPKHNWSKPGQVGSHLPRDEGVFPSSARSMMGLEE